MSASKNPYPRYYILNACFTNRQKRVWKKKELIRKLEENDFSVSGRTLDLDLYNMRFNEQLKFFAPIKFCRKEYGYHYTDPDYSIDKIQLTDEQLRAFEAIVNLMQPYKGTQLVRDFEGAIEKIVRGVDQLRRQKLSPAQQNIAVEQAPYYKGAGNIDIIKKAMDEKQSLRIVYQKFNTTKADEHVFHPYLLKEFKGRWYALGYSEQRHFNITLGLDRIEGIEPVDKKFRDDKKLNSQQFFKHTIGVTQGSGPVEDIVLWFSRSMGYYIKTQHIHETQHIIRDDEEGLVISLKLIINYELLAMLLGYCPEVSVISPPKLKNKLDELLTKGLEANGRKVAV
jgi:predicted DNA-binding transcriptional regulator YafY